MKRHVMCITKSFTQKCYIKSPLSIRCLSSQEAAERRHHLFTLEKKRQFESVGRIDKIEVRYKGVPKDCTLIMNKDISTPFDCARHFSEWHMETSALALLDSTVYWDMHRPLTESCTLEFQNFSVQDPLHVNKAFWRTCSLLLGVCASNAFKDTVPVILYSFPHPSIRSGSFTYDVDLPSLPDWQPTNQELYTLSAEYIKIIRQNLPLERLEISEELAKEMFIENPHKTNQIPSIANKNQGKITVYRVGTHVDISKGPLISNTSLIGRVAIPAVHKITDVEDSNVKHLYRFQGVALPTGVRLNHFAFDILVDRAKKFNSGKRTHKPSTDLPNPEHEKAEMRV